jgi:DNA-binding MarR family transcriptional regulator
MRPEKPAPVRDPDLYVLPVTVSRPELLDGDSDRRFRTLVCDLLSVASRMELVREHFGKRLGISGPQYTLLVAIAHFQGKHGISAGALAQVLHVSSAFVAAETGKLMRRNLLLKRVNPLDRRGVLLSVSPAGRLKLDRMAAEVRAVSDRFFGGLDTEAFSALCNAASRLVESSDKAVRYIASMKGVPHSLLRRVS